MASLFEESVRRLQQAHDGSSRRGPGGQTMPSPNTGVVLHSGGQLPALRSQQSQQQQAHKLAVEEQLRRAYREARIKPPGSGGDRLIVPASSGVIGSSQFTANLFNINRLGYEEKQTQQARNPVPRLIQHTVGAKPTRIPAHKEGIIVYGKQIGTDLVAPILVIKTRLIRKDVYTELPALSMDVVIHKPEKPVTIDLTPFDAILTNPSVPYDAIMINAGGDFAFGGGTGASIQIVIILKGSDRGIYVYRPEIINANIGLSMSLGASVGYIDFNEQNFDRIKKKRAALDRRIFEGTSQGWSAGWGPYSVSGVTSYVDGNWHGTDALSSQEQDILYTGVMGSGPLMSIPTEVKFGIQYSFSRSQIWLSFPIKL